MKKWVGTHRTDTLPSLNFYRSCLKRISYPVRKSGKLHLYKAIATKENTKQQMVDKIIDTVFEGSASQLVMSALGNNKSSKEELNAIRKYLDELEEGEK